MAFHLIRLEHNILKDARAKFGLTQQQVANKAGIQLRQYQRFETGERNLSSSSFSIACRVIEALGMDVTKYFHGDYIMGEETDITLPSDKQLKSKEGGIEWDKQS